MRNPWLCLTIVCSLGLGALLGMGGIVLLALYRIDAPQSIIGAVFTCIGALSSFLVTPPRGSVGLPGVKPPEVAQ